MSHHEEKNQAAKAKAKAQNQPSKQPGNRPQDNKGNPRDVNGEGVNAQPFRPGESERSYNR
ncbi:MAG TPA: hypothetical protein VKV19_09285 [Ktedonobacteraceae bacterium]|jgi:hypothetical protein|nr:hypothetical protein [Ktedonobacteraceae bacterium]